MTPWHLSSPRVDLWKLKLNWSILNLREKYVCSWQSRIRQHFHSKSRGHHFYHDLEILLFYNMDLNRIVGFAPSIDKQDATTNWVFSGGFGCLLNGLYPTWPASVGRFSLEGGLSGRCAFLSLFYFTSIGLLSWSFNIQIKLQTSYNPNGISTSECYLNLKHHNTFINFPSSSE